MSALPVTEQPVTVTEPSTSASTLSPPKLCLPSIYVLFAPVYQLMRPSSLRIPCIALLHHELFSKAADSELQDAAGVIQGYAVQAT